MIFSDRNLAQKIERAEARSNAAFVEARARVQPESGAEWIEVAGAYAMFDGVGSPITQTFGLGLFDEITSAELDKLENFFITRGAEVFHEVSPLADASLLTLLNERGYQPVELTSVMYRPLERQANLQPNPQIKIRITGAGEEKLWAQTSANGWSTEMDGLSEFMFNFGQISARCSMPFLAEIDNQPVATGALFVQDEVALLAGASTVPAGRGQGAQSALLAARLQYAAEQNCTIAIMGASPGSASQRNAQRNHFLIAYTRIKWQLKNK